MPEYSNNFSKRLVEAAQFLLLEAAQQNDASRAILYLSLVASEVSLKALLEKSGVPVTCLKQTKHSHIELVEIIYKCKLNIIEHGKSFDTPGTRINAVSLKSNSDTSLGMLFEAMRKSARGGISNFPNEIRYGETLKHLMPVHAVDMAEAITRFSEEYWDKISHPKDCTNCETKKIKQCPIIIMGKPPTLPGDS